MKKLRSHTFLLLTTSFLVGITLMVPAQSLMLWCDMMTNPFSMEMNMDSDMEHSMMSMHSDMDSPMDSASDATHCATDSISPISSSTEHCNISMECNCVITQNSDQQRASIAPIFTSLTVSVSKTPLCNLHLDSDNSEPFPPPIWNSSSYSPPSLFLANASFLI